MFEQINSQSLALGKSYADTFVKAQSLTLESFERITGVQLKALENRVNAAVEFWTEASEIRDFDGARAMWPKGVQLAKENAEKIYATGQEVFGIALKTGDALGALVKGSYETTNNTIAKQANAVKKAAGSR
ncbi:MAG: phasin family protein [Lysobacterales bacterium]